MLGFGSQVDGLGSFSTPPLYLSVILAVVLRLVVHVVCVFNEKFQKSQMSGCLWGLGMHHMCHPLSVIGLSYLVS